MQITILTPQKVRKVGNSLVVTIPADFAEQHNIKAEDLVRVTVETLTVLPRLRPELEQHAEHLLAEHREALIFLKEN
jgi:putative addiction module antidote